MNASLDFPAERPAPAGPAEIANRASLDSRRLDFEEIPIIDLAPMFGSERRAMEDCASALRRACTKVGFFYIVNHGVEEATIRSVLDQTRQLLRADGGSQTRVRPPRARAGIAATFPSRR